MIICKNISVPRQLFTQQNKTEEAQISSNHQMKKEKSAFFLHLFLEKQHLLLFWHRNIFAFSFIFSQNLFQTHSHFNNSKQKLQFASLFGHLFRFRSGLEKRCNLDLSEFNFTMGYFQTFWDKLLVIQQLFCQICFFRVAYNGLQSKRQFLYHVHVVVFAIYFDTAIAFEDEWELAEF